MEGGIRLTGLTEAKSVGILLGEQEAEAEPPEKSKWVLVERVIDATM